MRVGWSCFDICGYKNKIVNVNKGHVMACGKRGEEKRMETLFTNALLFNENIK